jgi:hypothetical protein
MRLVIIERLNAFYTGVDLYFTSLMPELNRYVIIWEYTCTPDIGHELYNNNYRDVGLDIYQDKASKSFYRAINLGDKPEYRIST